MRLISVIFRGAQLINSDLSGMTQNSDGIKIYLQKALEEANTPPLPTVDASTANTLSIPPANTLPIPQQGNLP